MTTAQASTATATGSLINAPSVNPLMWDDTTVELTTVQGRSEIPALPIVTRDLRMVTGAGAETLAFFALQVVKSQDKEVIIRAIASAAMMLLKTTTNLTGFNSAPIQLTGLDPVADQNALETQVLNTNFPDAEAVTVGELLNLMSADDDELGAYFGVLFMAGNKRVTNQNRTAFNEKRRNAATASIIVEPRIFIPDSIYLSDTVLHKVYATFLSYQPVRANLTFNVVQRLSNQAMGSELAFMSMFLLLADFGMSALRIIKEAVIKHPWIRTDFPELAPELAAAQKAVVTIQRAPANERPFLKAVHGNMFVPVNYSQIKNLTGVCKEILSRTVPSYANYNGGEITEIQAAVINRRLGISDTTGESARAE